MAEIALAGNLTRDPELKFTLGGRSIASFGVAENRRWKDNDGEWQEAVTYWNVQAWGELGENVAQSLKKGDRVVVRGRIEIRQYETDDGEKRSITEITAYNVGPDLSYATAEVTKIERYKQEGGEPVAPKPKRETRETTADRGDEPF